METEIQIIHKMKYAGNRILLILMKNGSRNTYSVPAYSTPEKILSVAMQTDGILSQDIKEILFFPHTVYELEHYQYFFEEDTKSIDEKPIIINAKIDQFRKDRNQLLKILDLEFLKLLELEDCAECKRRIVENKKYLRVGPQMMNTLFTNMTSEEIISYDPFNNIFQIDVLNGGSGYESAPEVTISAPDIPNINGNQMHAVAEIENGSVVSIKTTKVGSGYLKSPQVIVSKPQDPNGSVALLVASSPENDIFRLQ